MLTKKSIVNQFVVEYTGGGQSVSYMETADIYEDGVLLGQLRPIRKFIPLVDSQQLYGEISLGAWEEDQEYASGSVVISGPGFWQALQTSTGEVPSESEFWTQLPSPSETEQIVESIQRVAAVYVQDIIMDEGTSEADLDSIASLTPVWKAWKKYYAEDIVSREGSFYQSRSSHTSQPDWTPEVAVALWKKIHMGDEIPEWSQPYGGHDAYPAGFKVTHNGKVWVNTIDNNVWEPGVTGWVEEVAESAEPGEPDEPTISPWVQPVGGHDVYRLDDMVTHNGQTWISTNDANSWEPGVFGWVVVE